MSSVRTNSNSKSSSTSTAAISRKALSAFSWVSGKPRTVVSRSFVLRLPTPTSELMSMPPLMTTLSLQGESDMRSSSRSSR